MSLKVLIYKFCEHKFKARVTGERRREKVDGRGETGEGRREKGDGRRETGEGRRDKGDGRREMGKGRWEKEDRRRETGDGRRKKGVPFWRLLYSIDDLFAAKQLRVKLKSWCFTQFKLQYMVNPMSSLSTQDQKLLGVQMRNQDGKPSTVNVGNSRHIFVALPDNKSFKKFATPRCTSDFVFASVTREQESWRWCPALVFSALYCTCTVQSKEYISKKNWHRPRPSSLLPQN